MDRDHQQRIASTYTISGLVLYREGDYHDGAMFMAMYQKAFGKFRGCPRRSSLNCHYLPQHRRYLIAVKTRETMMVLLQCTKRLWQFKCLCFEITLTLPIPTSTVAWHCDIGKEIMMVPCRYFTNALLFKMLLWVQRTPLQGYVGSGSTKYTEREREIMTGRLLVRNRTSTSLRTTIPSRKPHRGYC
jgi:hypothetical protein